MEYLVEFAITVPAGTPDAEAERRYRAEAAAAADLASRGHLIRVWKPTAIPKILSLYRAESRSQLDALLAALPLYEWMDITVTALDAHPNDPGAVSEASSAWAVPATGRLPHPRLTPVYRLEATLAPPIDLGELPPGRRRIVPLTGGTFAGPELNGTLLPGASADWQLVRPDGTAYGDIRYTLRTDGGDLLYVQSRAVRHGSADVLARLARGEQVDAAEYVFRASTYIETAAPGLDWLNQGVFTTVGGRQPAGVVYETYLVG